jgi:3-methyladenine DNA glycosylase/8-oxoguanine DNA glycosylase
VYQKAKLHFKKADPILYQAALLYKVPDIRRSKDVFSDLVHAVTNQQLSGKAAATIFGRLEALLGRRALTAKNIASLSLSDMRKCGLSEAKVRTIQGIAQAIVKKEINLDTIHTRTDVEIIAALTSLKGIGPWTAEMILMFSLGRTDIFSKGDLGLRKGIMRLYGLRSMPSERFMDKISYSWSPYRTYAARVLWRVADAAKTKD